jgi:hypothetical protein
MAAEIAKATMPFFRANCFDRFVLWKIPQTAKCGSLLLKEYPPASYRKTAHENRFFFDFNERN